MTNLQNPPASDEVEVSLFGPGVGECVVVHLGEGDWIVVDSCVETGSGRPIALEYLDQLGVDVSKAVKLVVVTHWHDDHIKGASVILRAAQQAEVVCSAALSRDEFFEAVGAAEHALTESPGTAEFSAIFKTLTERAASGVRPQSIGPTWVMASQCLLSLRNMGRKCPAEVHALSPSSGSMSLAFHEIAHLLPQYGKPKRRAVALRPNQLGVVLWVGVGDVRLLLGSDLEESTSLTLGWQAVVRSTTRPTGRAQIFKVPHHGSKNADSPEVWDQMLDSSPHALLTAFASGSTPIPSETDIARLRRRTEHLYCTSPPKGWSPPRRSTTVEKTANEVARKRRAIVGPMGHVRVRSNCESPSSPSVELFGSATAL